MGLSIVANRFVGSRIDAANESVAFAVVPQDLLPIVADPLQHASLLPTPRVALTNFMPLVVVARVDIADLDHIVTRWRAPLKANLIGEDQFAGGIELAFVVVTEPMILRPAGDGSARHECLNRPWRSCEQCLRR